MTERNRVPTQRQIRNPKCEIRNVARFQDAKRRRAGLGSNDDRSTLGNDAKRSDDRLRPTAGDSDKSATVRRIRAESAERADEKVDGVASKQTLQRVDYEKILFPHTATRS